MEIKQHITLEIKKDDHTFVFHMPHGASYGNAIDASLDILQHVSKLAKDSVKIFKSESPSEDLGE